MALYSVWKEEKLNRGGFALKDCTEGDKLINAVESKIHKVVHLHS